MNNVIDEGKKYIMNTYASFPIVLDRGEGVYLYDEDGKKYLDFSSGIAVNCLGYNNEKLKNSMLEQLGKIHHCSNLYWTSPTIELAKKLIENSDFDKAFFCNSGAEAMESAIKLARRYGNKKYGYNRNQIITMKNSFHGRTIAAVTATGQEKYQEGFGPLLPNVVYSEYNNIDDLKSKLTENTCAIILEIIQGEGGINSIDLDFLKEVKKLTENKDIVLIFDEVQTGMGRTGTLFSYERLGVKPDIIALAKGLGGGIPIGAILAREEVAEAFEPGTHGSTFGGNPLAASAALVVLEELIDNGLVEKAKENGEYFKEKLMQLKEKNPKIKGVRGEGLMLGIEVEDPSTLIKKCIESGLLVIGAGEKVVRFVPPLIITKDEIDEGLKIIEELLI